MREDFRMAAYTDLRSRIKQVNSGVNLSASENVNREFAMARE